MRTRLCSIGLDRSIVNRIKETHFGPVIVHDMVPKFYVEEGVLYIERSNRVGFLKVDKVIFHGIYENDFDLITGLAIWGGACYPNALGMMNCRLKLPCLARALQVSRFNSQRGMISPETEIRVAKMTVGKWGNWHCGENKARFDKSWYSKEASVIEPFFEGNSVRVVSIGDAHLQINLEGSDWLKSIHDPKASIMEIDAELLEDTLAIKAHFGLQLIANDYIVGKNGEKHLLEVNHIPNVTRFEELQEIYFEKVTTWLNND